MFIWTAKFSRKRAVAAVLFMGLVMIGLIFLMGREPESEPLPQLPGNLQRVAYLRSLGWEVEPEPTGQMEVLVPAQFDQLYESYNDIQKAQGFDISRYKGERVMKYTYLVKNYPQEPEGAAANLLVYQGKLIGADLCSLRLGGFLRGAAEGEKGRS